MDVIISKFVKSSMFSYRYPHQTSLSASLVCTKRPCRHKQFRVALRLKNCYARKKDFWKRVQISTSDFSLCKQPKGVADIKQFRVALCPKEGYLKTCLPKITAICDSLNGPQPRYLVISLVHDYWLAQSSAISFEHCVQPDKHAPGMLYGSLLNYR